MHHYANNYDDDTASFLALSADFEEFVDTLSGVLRYVKAKNRSKHDVYLQWDEWNVWYKARLENDVQGQWGQAPHLIEEVYNLEDALVVAQWMNVFLRKSDVVKVACLAQIVNVIAPILTTRDSLLKQSIYYPFMLFSKLACGQGARRAGHRPDLRNASSSARMPLLDVSASYDEEHNTAAVFIVNRSQTDSLPVDLYWQDRAPKAIKSVHQVAGTDPKAANSFDNPNVIVAKPGDVPQLDGSTATLILPPLSFTAVEVAL